MIEQYPTRHPPSPFSPRPSRGRTYATPIPYTPDPISPFAMSPFASTIAQCSDLELEHPMPQTWQPSSTAIAYETQLMGPVILDTVNGLENDPTDNQSEELGVHGGLGYFDSLITPPTSDDQPQSSLSPTSSEFQPSTWPYSANDSWLCTSPKSGRAQSVHSSSETQPVAAPVRPPSPALEELYPDGFVLWDPEDPEKSDNIRERIPRNNAEMQKQKQDISALKKAGGSCMACYRAKKKCGTTTPCPPCASKGNRICFRCWGDLCLLGPPVGSSLAILGFPSQEAKDNLQRMSDEVFDRMNALKAVVNVREKYGGKCTAWHWTVTRSSITLSSKTECPVDDFLAGVTTTLPLVDLVKFENIHRPSPLVWTALKMTNMFMAIQGLTQARIRTSWYEITTGRLIFFYILILSFRKLAEMSNELCPVLYMALCGKDKQNSRSRTANKIDPAWLAAALYYRVVCGLEDLKTNPVVARIFGSSIRYLSGVRGKLEDILRNISPRHGATGKSSIRAVLEDEVPKLPSSLDVDMAFWLGVPDDPEQMPSVLSRHESPFSSPACAMQVFLADHFPRPLRKANAVEQHDGHSQSSSTSHDRVITQEQNVFDNVAHASQFEINDPNSLLDLLSNDNGNAFESNGCGL
ncbi:unnamed protein product [Penicillium glandicola]